MEKVGVVGFEVRYPNSPYLNTVWLVQELDNNKRVKVDLKSVNPKFWATNNHPGQHKVYRCNLYFCAEDPKIFADRIEEAVRHRDEVEGLLRKELYVDSMPTGGIPNNFSVESILQRTGLAGLANNPGFEESMKKIKRQVQLVEKKAVNAMVFQQCSKESQKNGADFLTLEADISKNIKIVKKALTSKNSARPTQGSFL